MQEQDNGLGHVLPRLVVLILLRLAAEPYPLPTFQVLGIERRPTKGFEIVPDRRHGSVGILGQSRREEGLAVVGEGIVSKRGADGGIVAQFVAFAARDRRLGGNSRYDDAATAFEPALAPFLSLRLVTGESFMATKFGVFVPQGWRMDLVEIDDPIEKYEAMTNVARDADKGGWDSIWVFDHFHTVPEPNKRKSWNWRTLPISATHHRRRRERSTPAIMAPSVRSTSRWSK
jgi:hypothetical protein